MGFEEYVEYMMEQFDEWCEWCAIRDWTWAACFAHVAMPC